jgi:GT2 family glycosyltransferase
MDLETLDVWWVSLKQMKSVKVGKQEFYESPALIGCAFAIGRVLYAALLGLDPDMQQWGVEDLDFGLKCWLMGYRILHDPKAIVGHRFQQQFTSYTVAPQHMVVNQLRTARKHLTESLWEAWVEKAAERNRAELKDHPEGLWAYAWELFQSRRKSVEHERSYLLGRRKYDEFWYAKRFDLSWPVMGAEAAPPAALDSTFPPIVPYKKTAFALSPTPALLRDDSYCF